jgi:hypothetical protein
MSIAKKHPERTRGSGAHTSSPSHGSGQRKRQLPPLEPPATEAKLDPALELQLFELVTAVASAEPFAYPPSWAVVVDAAKRRGYVKESALKLTLADHGRLWLQERAAPPPNARTYEMTKITAKARLLLKDLARETRVPMQDAIGEIIKAVYDARIELNRVALRHGESTPWDAIRHLVAKR